MGRRRKTHDAQASPAAAPPAVVEEGLQPWAWWWLLGIAVVLAVFVRLMLLPYAPQIGYAWDHDDYVRWGMQATDKGLLTLYKEPPAAHDIQVWKGGEWVKTQRAIDRVCNYPPGSAYLLYHSGLLFKAVSGDRLINTTVSRAVFGVWSIVADLFLAAGCAALAARAMSWTAARGVFLVMLFMPPLLWDSVIWGQMDSVVLAPLVWMLYFMLWHKWVWAGILWGVALALKPQAVLLLPVWAVAALVYRPQRLAVTTGAAVGAGVLFLVALPFTVTSGLAWFKQSYWENLTAAYSSFTTLKAFNIWYLDALLSDSLDTAGTWIGISKRVWGELLLVLGLVGGAAYVLRRRRRDPALLTVWTAVSMLVLVMLPTKVHERYLVLALPFLVVLAMRWWRLWPGLVMLIVVAMGQLTWPLWLDSSPGQWTQRRADLEQVFLDNEGQAPAPGTPAEAAMNSLLADAELAYDVQRSRSEGFEWMFTLLALFGTVLIAWALWTLPSPEDEGVVTAVEEESEALGAGVEASV